MFALLCALVSCSDEDYESNDENVERFNVDGVIFDMVRVDGGSYVMGSQYGHDNERPAHIEYVKTFYICKTEVTQALWVAVMGNNPSHFQGDNLPVEQLSWYDCLEFIVRLNRITGRNFRLPTEVEWEYAARGGNKSEGYIFSGGNDLDKVGWYYENADEKTHPVGSKQSNELGIYDMSGNVWEWTSDLLSSDYNSPRDMYPNSRHVTRGGGHNTDSDKCRSTYRRSSANNHHYEFQGIRIVLE